MAQRLMIIRHAEKPAPEDNVHGVDAAGRPDAAGLSVRGWQRTGALVSLFAPLGRSISDPRLIRPGAIYAATSHPRSQRPLLTVQPLAAALQLKVRDEFQSGRDEEKLIDEATRGTGSALICWRYDEIQRLGQAIGCAEVKNCGWDKDCYDAIWIFIRDGNSWRWVVAKQSLLPGDA
jgi:hypothetical protein